MSENKGREIFYGIVAVATLLVAIIGATLAYFTMSAGSAEGAINATSTHTSISYDDSKQVTAQASELVPASWEVVKRVYETRVKPSSADGSSTNTNQCIDDNSREVCSAYRFSVQSDANSKITAVLQTQNNGFTYLSYAVYNVTDGVWIDQDETQAKNKALATCGTEGNECYSDATGTKVYTAPATNSLFGYTLDGGNKKLGVQNVNAQKKEYEVVLFIKENDSNQNVDQGKEYTGNLLVTIVGNGMEGEHITGFLNPTE